MALAYTAPTWTDGEGQGITAAQLQAISNCIEGLVQGSDKAIHSLSFSDSSVTITYADGSQGTYPAGFKSISSISKTGTSGLVDTYTIQFSDGTSGTFTVTNGVVGTDGEDGEDGVSVTGVTLISTEGRVKTYRMSFSDGNHFDYEVTDGIDGGVEIDDDTTATDAVWSSSKVNTELENKLNSVNPVGSGNLSFNRKGNTTIGNNSIAMGYSSVASGHYSVALGKDCTASGICSTAEGYACGSSGGYGHAEGEMCGVTGEAGHAEGAGSSASGKYSHAEGENCVARGECSHAQNRSTLATGDSQTVLGRCNIADASLAVIIGNGNSTAARSNAVGIDWNGNVYIAGELRDMLSANNLCGYWEQMSASAGDTTITIPTDKVTSTSAIEVFSDNGTNTPVPHKTIAADGTNHTITITFDALEHDTTWKVHYYN